MGWQEQQEGAEPPPRDLPSPLPPHRPARSRATPSERPKVRERGCGRAAAPCRGAQGSTCPPGSPGPRCGNQVSPGLPRGSPLLWAPLPGDGLLHPVGFSALCPRVTWDPGLFEISCYFNTSVAGWEAALLLLPFYIPQEIPLEYPYCNSNLLLGEALCWTGS